MTRLELETRCEELLQDRAKIGADWGQAKINYDNLKDVQDDMLSAVVTEVQLEAVLREGKDYSETKARRLARSHPKWKEYREGVTAAKAQEFDLRMKYGNLKKEYDLFYARYLKS